MWQTGAGRFDRIFGEQLLVGGFEIARALTYRDSTRGAAGADGVGDGGDGGLTGFVLAQAKLHELEPYVFLAMVAGNAMARAGGASAGAGGGAGTAATGATSGTIATVAAVVAGVAAASASNSTAATH